MSDHTVPELRFAGFDDKWTNHDFGTMASFLRKNNLTRADLTTDDTGVRNVHYGDVLVKFDAVVDPADDEIPFVRDPSRGKLGDLLTDGDLIFADAAEDDSVGKICELRGIADLEVVSGLHTIPARPNGKFAAGFLGHALNADVFHHQLIPLMQGSKVSSISKSALSSCLVSYPSVQEQEAIGSLLSELDKLINQHRRRRRQLQQTKSGLMQQMLPQGDADEPGMRFDGFSGAWKQAELVELCDIVIGRTPSRKDPALWNGSNPWLTISDMSQRRTVCETTESISEAGAKYGKRIPSGTVLLSFKLTIGRVARAGRDLFTNEAIAALLVKDAQNLRDEYLMWYLDSRDLGGGTNRAAMGVTLNQDSLRAIPVMLPPSVDEQQAIGALFTELDSVIEAERRYIDRLQQVKSGLLQEMFV